MIVHKYTAELNLKDNTYQVLESTNRRRRAVGIPTLGEALRIAQALNAQVAQGTDKEAAGPGK